jgi:hypothetical protein
MPTDISTALPELDLPPGTTLEVDTGDAAAIVTQLNIYTLSPAATPAAPAELASLPFTYGPVAV